MRRHFLFNRKGQTLVEFSFVFFMLILLLACLIGLTVIAYHWTVLEYAASEGARFGSLGRIDPGFATREDSIRSRVIQITHNLGVDSVNVEFLNQAGGTSAGAASEFFKMRLSRTLELHPLIWVFFSMTGMDNEVPPVFQVAAWTVIRNEPF